MNEDMYNKICSVLPSLDIDFDSGIITTPRGGHGTIDGTGYLVFKKNNTKFQLHQVLAVYHFGKDCIGMTVNHENGDKLDNSRDNLELMTLSENVKHQWENGLSYDSASVTRSNSIKVIGTNIETGESVIFNSLNKASKQTHTDISCISKCVNGKQTKANGYVWKRL